MSKLKKKPEELEKISLWVDTPINATQRAMIKDHFKVLSDTRKCLLSEPESKQEMISVLLQSLALIEPKWQVFEHCLQWHDSLKYKGFLTVFNKEAKALPHNQQHDDSQQGTNLLRTRSSLSLPDENHYTLKPKASLIRNITKYDENLRDFTKNDEV